MTMLRQTSHHATISDNEMSTGIYRGRTIPDRGRVFLIFGRAADVQVVSTRYVEAQNLIRNMHAEGWALDRALVVTTRGNKSIMHIVNRKPVYRFPVISKVA